VILEPIIDYRLDKLTKMYEPVDVIKEFIDFFLLKYMGIK